MTTPSSTRLWRTRRRSQPLKSEKSKTLRRLLLCVVWIAFLALEIQMFRMILEGRKQQSSFQANQYDDADACPSLPERVRRMMGTGQHHLPSSEPMLQREFQSQWKHMVSDPSMSKSTSISGINNNSNNHYEDDSMNAPRAFVCPQSITTQDKDRNTFVSCRGVALVYPSRTMFDHVKSCITVLQVEDPLGMVDYGILGSHLLYSNRDTLTMVVDPTLPSLRASSWPDDYEVQIRRIVCLLYKQYGIDLVELNWHSFTMDETTGRIYLKETSFIHAILLLWKSKGSIWQKYTWTNLRNLISRYRQSPETKKQHQLDDLISKLRRFRSMDRTRIWKPPSTTK